MEMILGKVEMIIEAGIKEVMIEATIEVAKIEVATIETVEEVATIEIAVEEAMIVMNKAVVVSLKEAKDLVNSMKAVENTECIQPIY